jgi:hypothetical protein
MLPGAMGLGLDDLRRHLENAGLARQKCLQGSRAYEIFPGRRLAGSKRLSFARVPPRSLERDLCGIASGNKLVPEDQLNLRQFRDRFHQAAKAGVPPNTVHASTPRRSRTFGIPRVDTEIHRLGPGLIPHPPIESWFAE